MWYKMENKENEEYKKRIKELIDRIEKGDNSPEAYRQLLLKIEQIKRSAISITERQVRNERAIIGFVYALREYYWLRADPKYPFEKDRFLQEINALYKLIARELKKPNPHIPLKWDIDEKRRIVNNMKLVLGEEHISYFIKKYKIRRILRLKFEMREGYKYYVCCWIIAFIVLLSIWIGQRF